MRTLFQAKFVNYNRENEMCKFLKRNVQIFVFFAHQKQMEKQRLKCL